MAYFGIRQGFSIKNNGMPIPSVQTGKLIDSGGILLRMNVENTNLEIL
jgi:hypothetical protein